jgi:outer membrane protein OmpA-like peptidoglycan-associated protein
MAPALASAKPSVDVHVEAAAAHTVADKSDQFDWGGSALVSPELVLDRAFGLEVGVGALALSDGRNIDPPGVAPTSWTFAAFTTLGARVHPFAHLTSYQAVDADGVWIAGGAGAGLTADRVRPTVTASAGYDLRSPIVAAGPYVGYFQMIESGESLRPEDARIVMIGVHGSLSSSERKAVSDRDGDGIADDKDACPAAREDKDGFEDDDGCPDLDDDRDGIPDDEDRCPREAEDKDGFQDDDGCPDLDDDRDGFLDSADACPHDAEDLDGFQDDDGCPDLDDDRDGFPDAKDACPEEPETVNGIADADGCPDSEFVEVAGDDIYLDDRVHFDTDLGTVSRNSLPLLGHVAEFLIAHPEYELVRVEGHTDDVGPDAFNAPLSRLRAESVLEALVGFGVPRARLATDGFGATRPRAPGATPDARRENRRVELHIVRRARAGKGGRP